MSVIATMVNGARTGFGAIGIVLGIGAAILLPAGAAHAQFATPRGVMSGGVTEIRIEGGQRIAPETVRAYVTIQPGEAADAEQLDKSLKALFGTGLFADVAIRQEGSALVVRVVENPIVNPPPPPASPSKAIAG